MDQAKLKRELEMLAAAGVMPKDDAPAPEEEAAEAAEEQARGNGLLVTEYARRGTHFDVQLNPDQVVHAAEIIKEAGMSLDMVTGVDWLKEGQFEIVYDYFYTGGELFRVVVRARVDRDQPDIPTISEVFDGANWHERETWDLMGINFTDHPQLERFLLPEDADFHPLRKDFTP